VIKGIYSSASGMLPQVKKQEITANNVANAAATGFKKDRLFTKELTEAEKKSLKTNVDWIKPMVSKVFVDHSPGVFDRTGNPLDLAINGDGFFSIQLPDGSSSLTRAGAFEVNSDGVIAFPGGAVLLGDGGPIQVGTGKVTVTATGEVSVNDFPVANITPVTVDDLTQLKKLGNSLFLLPENAEVIPVRTSTILQGYLEASNVDVVHEMVEMIISYGNYEANANSLRSQDETLEKLFSRVGPR